MLKRSLFLLGGIFLLVSCNSDDNAGQGSNSALIKSITETIYYGGQVYETHTSQFTYTGNVLDKISASPDVYMQFFFEGQQLSKVEKVVNGEVVTTNEFTYDGERLIKVTDDSSPQNVTNFGYENGVLSSKVYGVFMDNNFIENQTDKFQFSAGNVVSQETISSVSHTQSAFTFDGNGNPFNGLNPNVRLVLQFEGVDVLSYNNPIMQTSVALPGGAASQYSYTYQFSPENNLPIQIDRKMAGILLSHVEIEYY